MHPVTSRAVVLGLSKASAPAQFGAVRASKKLFLPGELPAEFFNLLTKVFDRYQPTDLTDAHAVVDAVKAGWMYLRYSRMRTEYETKLCRRKPDISQRTAMETVRLDSMRGHEQRTRRTLKRAVNKIRPLLYTEGNPAIDYRDLLNLMMGIIDLEAWPYNV